MLVNFCFRAFHGESMTHNKRCRNGRALRHRSYSHEYNCFVFAAHSWAGTIISHRSWKSKHSWWTPYVARLPASESVLCARYARSYSYCSKQIVVSSQCTYALLGIRYRPAKPFLSPSVTTSLILYRRFANHESVWKKRAMYLSDFTLLWWKFNYRLVNSSLFSLKSGWMPMIHFLCYVFLYKHIIKLRYI